MEKPKLLSVRQDILYEKELTLSAKLILQNLINMQVLGNGNNPQCTIEHFERKFGIEERYAASAITELLRKGYIYDYCARRKNQYGNMVYEWGLDTGRINEDFTGAIYD